MRRQETTIRNSYRIAQPNYYCVKNKQFGVELFSRVGCLGHAHDRDALRHTWMAWRKPQGRSWDSLLVPRETGITALFHETSEPATYLP